MKGYGFARRAEYAVKHDKPVSEWVGEELTITAGELALYFSTLPPDMLVVATWEGQVKNILIQHIEIEEAPEWMYQPQPCAVIDVE